MKKINEIETREDLADLLNIPLKKITYVLYKIGPEKSYKTFEIPKKTGGTRKIQAPNKDLKDIQKKIAIILEEHQNNIWKTNNIKNEVSHGFQKKKSIITNAEKHKNKRYVMNIDIENFFGSLHFGRVKGFFERNKHFALPEKLAIIIAQLTCYNKSLPQGAPSSPIIANLICNILDMRIIILAKKYKLNYTRYADDLTFSTNNKYFLKHSNDFYSKLSKLMNESGLKINEKKTRLLYATSRQDVTGLVVNEKVNVNKNYYKNTRAMAHSLYTKGEFKINGVLGNLNQLEGRFSFINQLDWYNNIEDKKNFNKKKKKIGFYYLTAKEKQYQKFLFYKYFFANEKPLIITEGKTDVSYIKSALRKLHLDFPNLISKKEDGTFKFKVSFIRKSKRLKYFLNIQQDGADMMKNISNFFSNKDHKNYPNYAIEMKKDGMKPKKPVILIFDNEKIVKNNPKPLKAFLNHVGIKNEDYKMFVLNKNHLVNIQSNLYLVTHQLKENKKEGELEDLFHESLLIKKNMLESQSRERKHAKADFAEYVSLNYLNISFEDFRPLLNNINDIAKKY